MRVIVTGGAGFIGSCLIWKLNQKAISDIIVVDENDSALKMKNLDGKHISDFIEKDEFLESLTSGKIKGEFDFIVHMGACSSTTQFDVEYLNRNNYLYSQKLAEWALGRKIPFLYASSAATYGSGELGYSDEDEMTLKLNPLNPYGNSKQLFDLWVIRNKLSTQVTGFKFFNVFGPNEYHKGEMRSLIAKTFDAVLKEKKIRLFKSYKKEYADGEQKRDFIYIKDAVEIVYYFIEHLDQKGIFNVGTGTARTWNDVAKALFSALNFEPKIEYFDMPVEIREKYQYFTQADLAKLKRTGIKHEFFTLEEAVKEYAGYLRNNGYL